MIQIVLFLSIATTILTFVSVYLYLFLSIGFHLQAAQAMPLLLAIWVGSWLYILGEILARKLRIAWVKQVGALILGFYSIGVTIVSIAFALMIFTGPSPILTTITLLTILGIGIWGIINAKHPPVLRTLEVSCKKLSKEFHVVHLADFHIDRSKSVKTVHDIVSRTNALNPDVILITGDLIDANTNYLKPFAEALKQFRAKHGVFVVSGNHDYYAGIDKFEAFAQSANMKTLTNNHAIVDGIQIAGVPDESLRPNIIQTLSRCEPSQPIILLRHQPVAFEEAVERGVDLQLSGHTHRGQIIPWNYLVRLPFRYFYGLRRYKSGYIYTTSGVSTWGPPMRLGSRSEFAHIVLKPV